MSSDPARSLDKSRGLVVEDLPHVRRGLSSVLGQAFPSLSIDEAHDLQSALSRLGGERCYRIVLIDLGLPDGSGLDLIREVRRQRPTTLAIVTTIYDDDEHVFSAIAAGADGYLLKEHSPDVLVQHLQRLDQGLPALSPAVARRILGYFRNAPEWSLPRDPPADARPRDVPETQLTGRETEVLSLIGRGMQRGEVAGLLQISEHTVAKYLKDIYRKLNICSRAEAALEAQRRGLV